VFFEILQRPDLFRIRSSEFRVEEVNPNRNPRFLNLLSVCDLRRSTRVVSDQLTSAQITADARLQKSKAPREIPELEFEAWSFNGGWRLVLQWRLEVGAWSFHKCPQFSLIQLNSGYFGKIFFYSAYQWLRVRNSEEDKSKMRVLSRKIKGY
jgi:hypothetical protein